MKKALIGLAILGVVIIGIIFFVKKLNVQPAPIVEDKEPLVIGLSLGTIRTERWLKDRDFMIEKAKELGATVNVTMSDDDPVAQISQIENLISQGVKVIIVVSSDSEKLATAVDVANKAGVKIIAYDRLINNSSPDIYLSFDNVKVGKLEAESVLSAVSKGRFAYLGGSPKDNNAFLVKKGSMAVLDPGIKSGDIKLVLDEFIDGWKTEEAYKVMKSYLNSGKSLDAIVAANDGIAFGAIQALEEKGLAGKVPVSGQDAELASCQRIIEGTQTATVYKPIKALAVKAVEIAVALAKGQVPETNNSINNGKIDVPSYFLEPVIVNKDNMMDTVIKDGFHSYDEVYNNKPIE